MEFELITPNDIIKMAKYEVWVKRLPLLSLRFAKLRLVAKDRYYNRLSLVNDGYKLGDLKELVIKYGGVDLPVIN